MKKDNAQKNNYRLRIKTTVLIMILISALLVMMMFVNYKSSEKVVNDMLVKNASSQVKLHAQNFATWLNTRVAEIEMMSNMDVIRSQDADEIRSYLTKEKQRLKGIYLNFSITDINGDSYSDNNIRTNIRDDEYFEKTLAGKPVVSNPTASIENPNNLIVSFNVPIRTKNNTIGIITGTSLINTVFKQNTNFKVGKNDKVFLVDSKGFVIYSNDKNKKMGYNYAASNNKEEKQMMDSINKEKEGYMDMKVNGESHYIFYSPIDKTDWYLVLEVPKAEFMTPLSNLLGTSSISTLFTVLFIGIFVFVILSGIFKRLLKVSSVANEVSQGNLMVPLIKEKKKDEIGVLAQAVNHMLTNLKGMFEQINKEVTASATSVTDSSKELAANAEETALTSKKIAEMIENVSNDSKKQVEEVERNADLLAEMTEGINRITMSSTEVSNYSNQTAEKAIKGSESIANTTNQMDIIMKAVKSSTEVIGDLKTRSQEIGKIIEVINGVTEQINMLSLNASIEAARAGEHGKGFKVVAEEVKKLAQQTSDSANKISGLIEQTQNDVTKTETTMQKVYSEVEVGTKITQETGEAFVDILQSIKNVTTQTHEVSAVSEELLASSEEVLHSFNAIIKRIKENSKNFETVSDTSETQLESMKYVSKYADDLTKMAQDLQDLIKKINL